MRKTDLSVNGHADRVYLQLQFWSQFFFTSVFTVNLLYQVTIVQLNPFQLVLVGSVLELTVLLFELPTGIMADRISRKKSIIIGYSLIGCGFIMEGAVPEFTAVLVSQFLWGIGYTFTSGATQAWLADEIGSDKASAVFVKGARKENAAKFLAIPASILFGFASLNLPILYGGIGMIFLSILLIFFMRENHFEGQSCTIHSIREYAKETVKHIISFCRSSALMKLLLAITICFGFFSEAFDRLWISRLLQNPLLQQLNHDYSILLIGGIQFCVALASFWLLRFFDGYALFRHRSQLYKMLMLCSAIIILSLVGFAWSDKAVLLLFFYCSIFVARSIMSPLEDIWLNSIIGQSTTRATFFSVRGQVDAIGQIAGGPVIGGIAVRSSIAIAYTASAAILLPALLLYYKAMKKTG
ncbi:MFS transporter [Bacillus sp. 1P06AnD]|uniref:MFS transporter n=1 Tax=Bacillus sp. 1P06AnD TaxID=3132208 RepID=UPI0039A0A65F